MALGSIDAPHGEELDPLRAPRVAAIARLSAVDTVRARVTMAVDLGLLASNERLPSVEEMATAFGVSPASVLRGLGALQRDGVIVRRAGRYGGTFVREGAHGGADIPVRSFMEDDSTVHALIDERAVLEGGFAALAASHRSESQLEALQTLIDRMAETPSWAEFRNLDRAFHAGIAEAAGLPRAISLFARVTAQLDPYFLPYAMPYLHRSNEEHRDILVSLRAGDSGAAAERTIAHVLELHRSMYVGLRGGASETP